MLKSLMKELAMLIKRREEIKNIYVNKYELLIPDMTPEEKEMFQLMGISENADEYDQVLADIIDVKRMIREFHGLW